MSQPITRTMALGRGVTLEGVTVAYNALEGLVAIAAGLTAGSVALTGFGIDSVIEVGSGPVVVATAGRNGLNVLPASLEGEYGSRTTAGLAV